MSSSEAAGSLGPWPKPTRRALAPAVSARTCGCCGGWVSHVRAEGFAVKVDRPRRSRSNQDGWPNPRRAAVVPHRRDPRLCGRRACPGRRNSPTPRRSARPGRHRMPSGSPGMGGPAESLRSSASASGANRTLLGWHRLAAPVASVRK